MAEQRKQFGRRGQPGMAVAPNPYTGAVMPVAGMPGKVDPLTEVDGALRTFMLTVYNLMTLGLVITGIVAFLTYAMTVTTDPSLAFAFDDGSIAQITDTEYLNELGMLLWATPISYLVCFGPLLILIFTGAIWRSLPAAAAFVVFVIVAALIGVSFSGLALTYTNGSIAQMFFATAAAFGGLSLLGYTTTRDLSGWSTFLWMGLFGIIAAVLINWWLQSDALMFAVAVIGVIVFAGFTAYDTQMIKQAYSDRLSPEDARKLAISGALDLYLDFINMFRFLLFLFGREE